VIGSATVEALEVALIQRRVLSAVLSNWLSKAVALGVGFFLTPFILHRLGEVQYGLLALVGSVATIGNLLDLGIRPAVVKYVAENHARGDHQGARSLIATALMLQCFVGILTLLLTCASASLFPLLFNIPTSERAVATSLVLVAGAQLAISIPSAIPGAVLWGLHRYGFSNGISLAGTLASAVITVGVLLAGGSVTAMMASAIPINVGMQVITVLYINHIAPEIRIGWSDARRGLVRTILSFSSSMFVIDVAYSVQTRVDEIIIGAYMPVIAVGPYAIARRLGAIPQLFTEQLIGVFLPLASQFQAEGGGERLRSLYLVGSRLTLAMCAPLIGILVVFAGPLLALWVGEQYSHYAPIVVVLALAGVVEVAQWTGGAILQGTARHHGLAIASVCAALAKLALSALLVQYYGLIGLAVGTLIPTVALNCFYVLPYMMRVIRVRALELVGQVLLPVLLPMMVLMAILYGIKWLANPSGLFSIASAVIVGLTAYGLVYLLYGAGNPEWQLFRSLIIRLNRAVFLHQPPNW